ncbi:DUF1569 domain-containing protein [Winogradskyella sp. UBA3174]|uniref:DUF1569 domain-containing protein n=1 Tax=Winogradskyella sp. UBA3174 TaxID=1947785 RepID=UPI0025F7FA64|nr:DUF1569 domain-containing protein [Winogradskyella sp. UBA3174]|tara:strand:- start:33558 stop:34028 length:471 start_codon:yes stop_codon:yes gene_type:complete
MKASNITVLQNSLNQIEDYIQHSEATNITISKVNVAWHLDHSLKVFNAVVSNMQKSDPSTYENNFSFIGRIIFALKYIPRGKAKAPKHVMPSEIILVEDIKTQLAEARQHIKTIPTLDKNAYFKHPMFGNVNTSRVVRFLDAHTTHHLKIVRSILK